MNLEPGYGHAFHSSLMKPSLRCYHISTRSFKIPRFHFIRHCMEICNCSSFEAQAIGHITCFNPYDFMTRFEPLRRMKCDTWRSIWFDSVETSEKCIDDDDNDVLYVHRWMRGHIDRALKELARVSRWRDVVVR